MALSQSKMPTHIARAGGALYVKGVVSMQHRDHLFGPAIMEHGSLYFIVQGQVSFQFLNHDITGRANSGTFLWAPPITERIFETDDAGVFEYALLIAEAESPEPALPAFQLPDRPCVTRSSNPAYVERLFKTAETLWLQGSSLDQSEVCGLATVIIAQWLRSVSENETSPHLQQVIRKVTDYITQHYHRPDLSIHELVKLTPWSRRYFFRAFKEVTGKSPQSYINSIRLNRALDLLAHGKNTIKEVALSVGFQDPAYFSKVFHRHMGQSPSAFLRDMSRAERPNYRSVPRSIARASRHRSK